MIQFSKPTLGVEEEEAILKVMRSGWLAPGPETAAFEKEFAEYVGVKYAIYTNSGTAALKMAYKWVKEMKPGLAYLEYPKNTFCATYSAGIEIGLNIYPIQPKWGMSEEEYKSDPSIRVNMHYGGVKDETPCIIEDSAHRIEPNDPLIGKVRIYSFYVTKNMTTGSGGMFVTNDEDIYERARLYWKDGLTTSTADRLNGKAFYEVKAMAGGYDGNDIGAAMGRAQLRKLPSFTARRNEIRDRYNKALGQHWMGNHLYPFFVDSAEEAYECIDYLASRDIQAGYHYPGTDWKGVSLPIYPLLTDEQADEVIAACKSFKLKSDDRKQKI